MQGWREYVAIFLKGMAMGAADVVPGVSGGTIAFVSGIYERWVRALSHLSPAALTMWRRQGFAAMWAHVDGAFLLSLVAGIASAMLLFARAVRWLLLHQPLLLWAFFFGLVLACLWFLRRDVSRWHGGTLAAAFAGAAAAVAISLMPALSEGAHGLPYIFAAAALAICAMILPGVSGAFVLVLLGAYGALLDALHHWDVVVIATFAAGALVGLLSFARLLAWLFARHRDTLLAVLTGFVGGSLVKLWPWQTAAGHVWPWQMAEAQIPAALACMAGGFALVFVLETAAGRSNRS
ncbi:MAG: DUF368 domain-containing protein [Cardiobacteriaceae bacterium]|nr:DUF368 domain-containing protein [Cardiobacteriaceae bacterium]